MGTAHKMDLHTYIESLPSLIGHVPAQSLIITGFSDTATTSGMARVDLPESLDTIEAQFAATAQALQGVPRVLEWRRVLVVAWCEGQRTEVARAMLAVVVAQSRKAGWDVIGQFLVTGATITGTTYGSDQQPTELLYLRDPHLGDEARQQKGLASSPLPKDRAAMAEQVAHDGSPAACSRPPLLRPEYLDLWHQVINTGTQDVSLLSGEQVALLGTGLLSMTVRDAIVGSFTFTNVEDMRPTGDLGQIIESWDSIGTHREITERLRLLVRRTPDGTPATNLLTILALRAYFAEKTALATAALERATRIQPDHRLAMLVGVMIRNGVKPPA